METKNCEQCGQVFEYTPNPNFPRKYCPPCSAAKKASYEAKKLGGNIGGNVDLSKPVIMEAAPVFKSQPSRDHSIVAQVFVKEASAQLIATMALLDTDALADFSSEGFMKHAINELHEAYNHALELLDGN